MKIYYWVQLCSWFQHSPFHWVLLPLIMVSVSHTDFSLMFPGIGLWFFFHYSDFIHECALLFLHWWLQNHQHFPLETFLSLLWLPMGTSNTAYPEFSLLSSQTCLFFFCSFIYLCSLTTYIDLQTAMVQTMFQALGMQSWKINWPQGDVCLVYFFLLPVSLTAWDLPGQKPLCISHFIFHIRQFATLHWFLFETQQNLKLYATLPLR